MKTNLYLAYGSNMDLAQMSYRCPDACLVGVSEITDYRLIFKGSKTGSYATIEPQKGSKVPVLVWEISERDERNLDRYEGFPVFYQKKTLSVKVASESGVATVDAMAYIMDPKRPFGIPTDYYYGVIEEAYERFGFDESILEKAFDDSLKQMKAPCLING